jgi:hypothetical protein
VTLRKQPPPRLAPPTRPKFRSKAGPNADAQAEAEFISALAALLVEDVLRRPRINIQPKRPTLRLVRR